MCQTRVFILQVLLSVFLLSTNISVGQKIYLDLPIDTFLLDQDFPEQLNLSGEQVTDYDDHFKSPNTLVLIDDYLVLGDNEANKWLHLVDIKKEKYIGNFIEIGEKENQLSQLFFLRKNSANSFTVYDHSQKKYMIYTIDELIQNSKPTINSHLQIEGIPMFLHDNTKEIYYSGFLSDTTRLTKINKKTKETKGYGRLVVPHKKRKTSYVRNQISAAHTIYNHNHIVFVYNDIPMVELFDIKTRTFKRILLTSDDLPIYYAGIENGQEMYAATGDTFIYFSSAYLTKSHIYIQYVGHKITDDDKEDSILYILDYDLNPIKKLKLNKSIHDFVVSDDKVIYGLNQKGRFEKPKLIKYQLK